MLNHARTLLLNLAGDPDAVVGATPGDEAIPPAFVPLTRLDAGPRNVLFGSNPDRFMLNYRGRQLLTMLHALPLVELVLALDSRYTYAIGQDNTLANPAFYRPVVTPAVGLALAGSVTAPDASGRCRGSWQIQQLDSTTALVTDNLTGWFGEVAAGPNTATPLAFGLSVTTNGVPGSSWLVELYRKPQRDPGQLLAGLSQLSAATLTGVFFPNNQEPYRTCWNVWSQRQEVPWRLSAFLTAYILQLNQLWESGNG